MVKIEDFYECTQILIRELERLRVEIRRIADALEEAVEVNEDGEKT